MQWPAQILFWVSQGDLIYNCLIGDDNHSYHHVHICCLAPLNVHHIVVIPLTYHSFVIWSKRGEFKSVLHWFGHWKAFVWSAQAWQPLKEKIGTFKRHKCFTLEVRSFKFDRHLVVMRQIAGKELTTPIFQRVRQKNGGLQGPKWIIFLTKRIELVC